MTTAKKGIHIYIDESNQEDESLILYYLDKYDEWIDHFYLIVRQSERLIHWQKKLPNKWYQSNGRGSILLWNQEPKFKDLMKLAMIDYHFRNDQSEITKNVTWIHLQLPKFCQMFHLVYEWNKIKQEYSDWEIFISLPD